MNVNGKPTRTIKLVTQEGRDCIEIIDQRKLPHRFEQSILHSTEEVKVAIRDMYVRGAPLIGATAALGMYLATVEINDCLLSAELSSESQRRKFSTMVHTAAEALRQTRPTAVNLMWAIEEQLEVISNTPDLQQKQEAAKIKALEIIESDVNQCRRIGLHGLELIKKISEGKSGEAVNILTHCNAGWLATVDWGTATSPIYHAFNQGIDIHVWVDETRPRNQGAKLTAWELDQHGVNHTVIADNTGGHLMQRGLVDMVIVGTDRTILNGDVANKIGTYLKALAAKDNQIPFYVALPSTTFDKNLENGLEIPIEERSGDEVRFVDGLIDNQIREVLIPPPTSPVCNYAFDVTPARLISGLITERGVCRANKRSIIQMFPEFI